MPVLTEGDRFDIFKRLDLRFAASGDQTLVAAVTGKPITLLALMIYVEPTAAGSETIIFKSGTTAISVQFVFQPGDGVLLPFGSLPPYICQTAAGEALVANFANGYAVRLLGSYYEG